MSSSSKSIAKPEILYICNKVVNETSPTLSFTQVIRLNASFIESHLASHSLLYSIKTLATPRNPTIPIEGNAYKKVALDCCGESTCVDSTCPNTRFIHPRNLVKPSSLACSLSLEEPDTTEQALEAEISNPSWTPTCMRMVQQILGDCEHAIPNLPKKFWYLEMTEADVAFLQQLGLVPYSFWYVWHSLYTPLCQEAIRQQKIPLFMFTPFVLTYPTFTYPTSETLVSLFGSKDTFPSVQKLGWLRVFIEVPLRLKDVGLIEYLMSWNPDFLYFDHSQLITEPLNRHAKANGDFIPKNGTLGYIQYESNEIRFSANVEHTCTFAFPKWLSGEECIRRCCQLLFHDVKRLRDFLLSIGKEKGASTCVESTRILGLSNGLFSLPLEERKKHVDKCPYCRTKWQRLTRRGLNRGRTLWDHPEGLNAQEDFNDFLSSSDEEKDSKPGTSKKTSTSSRVKHNKSFVLPADERVDIFLEMMVQKLKGFVPPAPPTLLLECTYAIDWILTCRVSVAKQIHLLNAAWFLAVYVGYASLATHIESKLLPIVKTWEDKIHKDGNASATKWKSYRKTVFELKKTGTLTIVKKPPLLHVGEPHLVNMHRGNLLLSKPTGLPQWYRCLQHIESLGKRKGQRSGTDSDDESDHTRKVSGLSPSCWLSSTIETKETTQLVFEYCRYLPRVFQLLFGERKPADPKDTVEARWHTDCESWGQGHQWISVFTQVLGPQQHQLAEKRFGPAGILTHVIYTLIHMQLRPSRPWSNPSRAHALLRQYNQPYMTFHGCNVWSTPEGTRITAKPGIYMSWVYRMHTANTQGYPPSARAQVWRYLAPLVSSLTTKKKGSSKKEEEEDEPMGIKPKRSTIRPVLSVCRKEEGYWYATNATLYNKYGIYEEEKGDQHCAAYGYEPHRQPFREFQCQYYQFWYILRVYQINRYKTSMRTWCATEATTQIREKRYYLIFMLKKWLTHVVGKEATPAECIELGKSWFLNVWTHYMMYCLHKEVLNVHGVVVVSTSNPFHILPWFAVQELRIVLTFLPGHLRRAFITGLFMGLVFYIEHILKFQSKYEWATATRVHTVYLHYALNLFVRELVQHWIVTKNQILELFQTYPFIPNVCTQFRMKVHVPSTNPMSLFEETPRPRKRASLQDVSSSSVKRKTPLVQKEKRQEDLKKPKLTV